MAEAAPSVDPQAAAEALGIDQNRDQRRLRLARRPGKGASTGTSLGDHDRKQQTDIVVLEQRQRMLDNNIEPTIETQISIYR